MDVGTKSNQPHALKQQRENPSTSNYESRSNDNPTEDFQANGTFVHILNNHHLQNDPPDNEPEDSILGTTKIIHSHYPLRDARLKQNTARMSRARDPPSSSLKGMLFRVSQSAYSLSAMTDADPLINNGDIEDPNEVTEWSLDDYATSLEKPSRSASFQNGFMGFLLGKRRNSFMSSEHNFSTRGSTVGRPVGCFGYQTIICVTAGLCILCAFIGAIIGRTLFASTQSSCIAEPHDLTKWHRMLTFILQTKEDKKWEEISFTKDSSLVGLSSQTVETITSTTWLPMVLKVKDLSSGLNANIQTTGPSRINIGQIFRMGTLIYVDSCSRLVWELAQNRSTSTILNCHLNPQEVDQFKPPAVADSLVVLVIVTLKQNQMSQVRSSKLFQYFEHADHLPPFIFVLAELPSSFGDRQVLISVTSQKHSFSSQLRTGYIKGTASIPEYVLISGDLSKPESAALFQSSATVLAALQQRGWQPYRTLIFLLWESKSPMQANREDWYLKHKEMLEARSVLFIDTENLGLNEEENGVTDWLQFIGKGSPTVRQLLYETSKLVLDRSSNEVDGLSVYDSWMNCFPQPVSAMNFSIPFLAPVDIETMANLIELKLGIPVIQLSYESLREDYNQGYMKNCLKALPNVKKFPDYSGAMRNLKREQLQTLTSLLCQLILSTSTNYVIPYNLIDLMHTLHSSWLLIRYNLASLKSHFEITRLPIHVSKLELNSTDQRVQLPPDLNSARQKLNDSITTLWQQSPAFKDNFQELEDLQSQASRIHGYIDFSMNGRDKLKILDINQRMIHIQKNIQDFLTKYSHNLNFAPLIMLLQSLKSNILTLNTEISANTLDYLHCFLTDLEISIHTALQLVKAANEL